MKQFDLHSLPLEQKVGQLFFIGLPGPELNEETEMLLAQVEPGGICLFARNIREPIQTRKLLDYLSSRTSIPPFLSLDQEGGRVDRLRRILTPMPAADRLRSPEDARELGVLVADAIGLLGFNMDFAPVVDVIDSERQHLINGLQTRGLGHSKEDVARFADEFVTSIEAGGILGCLKHFPGLAAAEVDSHEELPVVEVNDTMLREVDLYPYRELLEKHRSLSVMVAHATFPNTDLQETDSNGKLLPSSLSRQIVSTLLRDEINFNGISITDDMEMGAILKNYGIGEACRLAIEAGEDMLAICADPKNIYDGYRSVLAAVRCGEITEVRIDESLARIAVTKSMISKRREFSGEGFADLSDRVAEFNDRLSMDN